MRAGRFTVCASVLLAVAACSTDRQLLRRLPSKPTDPVFILEGDAGREPSERISTDPHALLGIEPASGPFSGGQLALLRGNGFDKEVGVWICGRRVPAKDVFALDPNRIQVRVPEGDVGPCDVSTQRGDDDETRRTLVEGYRYESFFVEPSSGPTRGGTRITLTGKDNAWTKDTKVTVDLQPCEVSALHALDGGLQELECQTPTGTPGAKVVSTTNPAPDTEGPSSKDAGAQRDVDTSVSGAFTYVESETGFEGGLGGKALARKLEVTLLDSLFGEPLAGVQVGLGQATDAGTLVASDEHGVAHFDGELGPVQTVTVAGHCLQPITVADVNVEKLTLYVDPVLTPACIPFDFDFPEITGGSGGGAPDLKQVKGTLSWGTGVELKQTSWINVPKPADSTEKQVAYVFELARSVDSTFTLPGRIDAVFTDERGPFGYPFTYYTTSSANITLYALAGLERGVGAERTFTPYALGIERGAVPGDEELRPVIDMNIVLDRTVSVDVENPARIGTDPDRVNVQLALRVGRTGFIPLPGASRNAPLPLSGPVEFRGVPALIYGLEGAEYVARAEAISGADEALPLANVEAAARPSSDSPIPITGFIGIPELVAPAPSSGWSDRLLEWNSDIAGSFDLWSIRVDAGGDQFTWRIVAPRERSKLRLPDLSLWGAALPTGPARIRINAARVRDFDYARLRQQSFTSAGWTAYSANLFAVQIQPAVAE